MNSSVRAWLLKFLLSFGTLCVLSGILEITFRVAGLGPLKRYSFSETRLWEYTPNQVTRTNINRKVVRINSMGLREGEIPLKRPEGVFRILVVGDSTSFGYSIDLEDTYIKVLERKLNALPSDRRYQVINAAVNKYDATQERILLEEVGVRYQPNLVLAAFSLNDIRVDNRPPIPEEGPVSKEHLEKVRRRIAQVNVIKKSALLSRIYLMYKSLNLVFEYKKEEGYASKGVWAILSDRYKPLTNGNENDVSPIINENWARTMQEYRKMFAVCRANSADFVTTYIPYGFVLEWPSEGFSRPRNELLRLQEETGARYIDVLPGIRGAREDLWLKNDPIHMNEAGFQVVAEALMRELGQL